MLDILVVAPHPDDAELGMGGAIVKFKSEGHKVGVLDLTNGEPTPQGDPQTRARDRCTYRLTRRRHRAVVSRQPVLQYGTCVKGRYSQ